MITVDKPASFEWNEANCQWAKNYLTSKSSVIMPFTDQLELDIQTLKESQFTQLCQLLETTAEGREIRNKMFKAWRSKKSRDNDDGKKLYTFNMSVKAGIQLKKIAKNAPLNKTLEALIFLEKSNQQEAKTLQQQVSLLQKENEQLKDALSTANLNIEAQDGNSDSLSEDELDIKALAKMEKSQLVKKIVLLKRKLSHAP